MKQYSLFSIVIGIISCITFWYFALFTDKLIDDSIFGTVYINLTLFVSSHLFAYFSIKRYLDRNKLLNDFYCYNLYIGKDNIKCKKQCSNCFKIDKSLN